MKELILKHLQDFGSITSLEAISKYKCTRLGHYIYLLRRDGLSISGERVQFTHSVTGTKSSYVRYRLETQQEKEGYDEYWFN